MQIIKAVPVTVITGFLGVGKTTAILHLLKHKPTDERWAVLVNEFGEIGIDGNLITGGNLPESGIYVREIPGGCMCCVAGVPMQVALNLLLTRTKPDRLLIEPTGLGHPQEVLAILAAPHYRHVLQRQATITLVDARKIADSRYTGNTTFNQQLQVADVIVANKADQYAGQDFARLTSYLAVNSSLAIKPLIKVEHGEIPLSLLQMPALTAQARHPRDTPLWQARTVNQHTELPEDPELPNCGYLKVTGQRDGLHTAGWRFHPTLVFDRQQMFNLAHQLPLERLKAILITDDGVLAYNLADGVLTEITLDDALESRVEIITASEDHLATFENRLMALANANSDAGERQ